MNKSPESIVLAVALALLALGAAGMAYWFPSLSDITGVSSTAPTGHVPKKLKPEEVQSSLAAWNSPVLWNAPEKDHRLFISDGFLFYASLYPSGNYLQKDDGTARTAGGVLISWYRKYSLDFTDPNIDREDPDGDGFSNKAEFMNEAAKAELEDGTKSTNPLDPQSHPSYIARLRLDKYESRPFHIQFRGHDTINGETVFQIYLKDVPSANQPGFKKIGDQLGAEGYKITAYRPKMVNEKVDGIDVPTDETELDLEKPEIGFKITLIYRKEINSPESTADFVMLMPAETNKVFKVATGKILILPELPNEQFRVREIKETGAIIRDVKTNQDYTIPKLGTNEWNDVPTPPAAASQKSP